MLVICPEFTGEIPSAALRMEPQDSLCHWQLKELRQPTLKKGGKFVCKTYKDLMTQHTKNSPVAGRVAEPDSWPTQYLIEKRIVHLKGTVGAVNCLQLHISVRFTCKHLFVLESTADDLPANCLLLRLHKKAG